MAILSDHQEDQDSNKNRDIQQTTAMEEEEKRTKLGPNKGNGVDMENYSWTQNLQEVSIHVPVPQGAGSKLVLCDIKKNYVKVRLKSQPLVIDRELFQSVKVDDSFWSLEDKTTITLPLTKNNGSDWWKSLLKGGPDIDTQKAEPEASKLSDLDSETRASVEKMMFEQRQKQLGLPTSEEIEKQKLLKQFMAQHPDTNFSQGKIMLYVAAKISKKTGIHQSWLNQKQANCLAFTDAGASTHPPPIFFLVRDFEFPRDVAACFLFKWTKVQQRKRKTIQKAQSGWKGTKSSDKTEPSNNERGKLSRKLNLAGRERNRQTKQLVQTSSNVEKTNKKRCRWLIQTVAGRNDVLGTQQPLQKIKTNSSRKPTELTTGTASKLSDLDSETRAAVEKMMFDQRQKELGLPSTIATMLWCSHCTGYGQPLCQDDFLSCSGCGKVLSMLNWQRRFKTRNSRIKRTKRRRRTIQETDDESCVTGESSGNIDDGLSDKAEMPK
ncbi:unnamed protein product [Dovyalis caffra]|uniref:CS domain-containing protein n=1 Tax=Dovyalis caffra TaxID=77055 RepID=A0AAV1RA45_9ROSI|nr:unnamed protein product [Dovyalis caffra]